MNTDTLLHTDDVLKSQLHSSFASLGLRPIDSPLSPSNRPTSFRRGTLRPPTDTMELLSLVRDPAGVLRWELGAAAFGSVPALRRAGRAALPPGRVIQQFAYEQIAPNSVTATLAKLDKHLTPKTGLRRWNAKTETLDDFPDGTQVKNKRVLLFIHGTFSNCDNMIQEVLAAPNGSGREFLNLARQKYDFVLTFDHPTVGVSPVMNAFDLAALLRPLPKELHIVCHSRGGLVTRWFLEGFATDDLRSSARAVMVATSIAGTSLASPASIRSAMDYLANLGDILGRLSKLGSAHPFIATAGVLTQVLTSAARFGAKTPIFDAAIALIPGLQGQSKVGNNPELGRLRSNTGASVKSSGITFYAVRADFQPKDVGWNFLQYFSKPMQRLANWGADLIFEGANDLVVDCASMDDLADEEKIEVVHNYGTTEVVFHTNYFRQKPTIDFISTSLGLHQTSISCVTPKT